MAILRLLRVGSMHCLFGAGGGLLDRPLRARFRQPPFRCWAALRCSIYMFRFCGSFIILIGLRSSIPPTSSICTLFRCPSFSWWCRDPGPCARWVCVVCSFGLVGGHPPCGPHGFRFTPFDHFCTRNPVGYWSALHTCQPSDSIFKSYRILFSLQGSSVGGRHRIL